MIDAVGASRAACDVQLKQEAMDCHSATQSGRPVGAHATLMDSGKVK